MPLFVIVISLCLVACVSKKAAPKVIKEDLQLIECDVCKNVVEQLFTQTEEHRKEAGKKKLEEILISEAVDNVCLSDHEKGVWMRSLDITRTGAGVGLKSMSGTSKCEEECVTIARSCSDLLLSGDEIDRDDLSAMLWKGNLSKKQLEVSSIRFNNF